MVLHNRFVVQVAWTGILSLPLILSVLDKETWAESPTAATWAVVQIRVETPRANILHCPQRRVNADLPTFLITHGMGGTKPDDRFHQLADAIQTTEPEANVLIVDWSKDATQTSSLLGLTVPWQVASSIDPVARDVTESLLALQIDPHKTTFIGESFGNWVNARIAEKLGRKGKILAFNPANTAGGYPIPDLRKCADLSCSFHTYSIFDSQVQMAHTGYFLETPVSASEIDQHTHGISWLVRRIHSGDLRWLHAQPVPGVTDAKLFDATATLSGDLLQRRMPRKRPDSNQDREGLSQLTFMTP